MSMALTALANQISGRSDREILQIARLSIGVEPLLDLAWERAAAAVDRDLAEDVLLAWKLHEGDAGVEYDYVLVIEDGGAWHERGEEPDADVWLESSVPDFFRLMLQLVEWEGSIAEGRLTVRGDLGLLARLGGMFKPTEFTPG